MSEDEWEFDVVLDEPGETLVEPVKEKEGVAIGKATQGTLRSGETGECYTIGAHDPEEDVVYMAHIDDSDREREKLVYIVRRFLSLIEQSKGGVDDLGEVNFLLGGSSYKNPYENESDSQLSQSDVWDIGGTRLTMKQMLKGKSDNVEVHWGAEDGQYSEVVADLGSDEVLSYNAKKDHRS